MNTDPPPAGARRSPMLAVGSVALATSLIGTIGTAAELGPDSLSTVATGSWRAVIGAAGLMTVSLIRKEAPWQYPMAARWVVLGALMVATVQLAFFEAVSRTGVAVGTLVMIGISVVAGGGIDWLAHRHRPGGRWLVGVVVAVGGVALLSGGHRMWYGAGWLWRRWPDAASRPSGSPLNSSCGAVRSSRP